MKEEVKTFRIVERVELYRRQEKNKTIPNWDGDLLKMTRCLSNLFEDKMFCWIGTAMLTAKNS